MWKVYISLAFRQKLETSNRTSSIPLIRGKLCHFVIETSKFAPLWIRFLPRLSPFSIRLIRLFVADNSILASPSFYIYMYIYFTILNDEKDQIF